MDYKKEYKKLKADIKKAYLFAQTNSTKAVLENILPELRESEDERVRNEIVAFVEQAIHRGGGTPIPQEQEDSWLAWLEKQRGSQNEVRYWTEEEIEPIISDFLRGAEHYGGMIARLRYLKPKSLEKQSKESKVEEAMREVEEKAEAFTAAHQGENAGVILAEMRGDIKPKFHEGDWISGYYTNYRVTAINSKGYVVEDTDGYKINILFENEKFHHLFTIADAKNGDILVAKDGRPFIFRDCSDTKHPNAPVAYCGIDCANRFSIGESNRWWTDEKVCPATKKQRLLLFSKMKEAGYEWDEKKKELKKLTQQKVTLIIPDGKRAERINDVLTLVDDPKVDNRPVTERIKTFTDAMEALGQGNPLVEEYIAVRDKLRTDAGDLIAYLKLRIIVAALNEGWEPKFEKGEYRYFPWFYLYTKEQYDELDDEEKGRCVLRSGGNTISSNVFVNCNADHDASYSYTFGGSRLAFRTRELAAYAGRQFIEEWADFMFKPQTK